MFGIPPCRIQSPFRHVRGNALLGTKVLPASSTSIRSYPSQGHPRLDGLNPIQRGFSTRTRTATPDNNMYRLLHHVCVFVCFCVCWCMSVCARQVRPPSNPIRAFSSLCEDRSDFSYPRVHSLFRVRLVLIGRILARVYTAVTVSARVCRAPNSTRAPARSFPLRFTASGVNAHI